MLRKNGFVCFALAVLSVSTVVQAGNKKSPQSLTQTYAISIKGMTCQRCSEHVQEKLAAVPGVVKAKVNYKAGNAWVTAKQTKQGRKQASLSRQLAAAVKQAGYHPTINYVLKIQGMTCEACASHAQEAMAEVPGVAAVSVDYKGKYAVVRPTDKAGNLSKDLVAAVQKAGYKAAVHTGP